MNYTSIEQSKKLIEAGLPIETADMHYINNKHPGCVPYQEMKKTNNEWLQGTEITPCWSIDALLDIMPKTIPHKDFSVLETRKQWVYGWILTPSTLYYGCKVICEHTECYIDSLVEFHYTDSIIEALYNMVVWLLENNYIKKG